MFFFMVNCRFVYPKCWHIASHDSHVLQFRIHIHIPSNWAIGIPVGCDFHMMLCMCMLAYELLVRCDRMLKYDGIWLVFIYSSCQIVKLICTGIRMAARIRNKHSSSAFFVNFISHFSTTGMLLDLLSWLSFFPNALVKLLSVPVHVFTPHVPVQWKITKNWIDVF